MKMHTSYIFILFSLPFNLFGAINIDIAIQVSHNSFGFNKKLEPMAYENLPQVNKDQFSDEALRKAELYCRQALGFNVIITHEKSWHSLHQERPRSVSVFHNCKIRCMRELNLDDHDPFIGKYLDHARFVLANFSSLSPKDINHQLLKNTLNILSQIGAPAIPTLWAYYLDRKKVEQKPVSKAIKRILNMEPNSLLKLLEVYCQLGEKYEDYKTDLLGLRECEEKLPSLSPLLSPVLLKYALSILEAWQLWALKCNGNEFI